jgi:hypothetical protein
MSPPLVVAFALAGDAARNLRDEPFRRSRRPQGRPCGHLARCRRGRCGARHRRRPERLRPGLRGGDRPPRMARPREPVGGALRLEPRVHDPAASPVRIDGRRLAPGPLRGAPPCSSSATTSPPITSRRRAPFRRTAWSPIFSSPAARTAAISTYSPRARQLGGDAAGRVPQPVAAQPARPPKRPWRTPATRPAARSSPSGRPPNAIGARASPWSWSRVSATAPGPRAIGRPRGQRLLGIRAVLAESFERIHRSNLVGMGVLPLQLPPGSGPQDLLLRSGDRIEIDAANIAPRAPVPVAVIRRDGSRTRSRPGPPWRRSSRWSCCATAA